jgi:hypothetical protein
MAETSPFIIRDHLVPGQHIREYARATSTSQTEVLKLAVKEYVPRDNIEPREGDVTVIGAHANGFPKVCNFLSFLFTYRFLFYCIQEEGEGQKTAREIGGFIKGL